ncbi:hypothetical protein B0H13DRAFT_128032 [Mycena leptocephala]|nr:hypothetical protein B0H13DRAFT_128032 [Mycena leptocephala]
MSNVPRRRAGHDAAFDSADGRSNAIISTRVVEGPIVENQAHELTDLSTITLHRRIAALEATIQNMTQDSPTQRPLATVTPWRVLNSVLVLGLGAYKAISTYLGQTTGPTTADWIIGVAWTLMAYWVSFFDNPSPGGSSWFFTYDMSGVLFPLFENIEGLGITIASSMIIFKTADALPIERLGVKIFAQAFIYSVMLEALSALILRIYLDIRVLLLPTLSKLLGKRRFPNFPRSLFNASDWSLMRNNLGVGQLFGFQALIAYILVSRLLSSDRLLDQDDMDFKSDIKVYSGLALLFICSSIACGLFRMIRRLIHSRFSI